ncbi:malto-oligosyltrehalose trehalohydrolase [Filimonas effusa]|uniref:Malto-oligosyltrehalose trehalohydrolase n=1 Tax=Filimonas effusa TaxID=2508721 RepID=A0A4Q1DBU0_9BACT|nr:malto-oligosyltrehalose trehalohydrolase [Filimonas effusa]RXK86912.1 malto-oligosyltrehalose trehalohydrolase [Filimonas effusa]
MKKQLSSFSVWAPEKESMILNIVHPIQQKIDMQKDERGYFHASVPHAEQGLRYYYIPEGGSDTPDPRSHFQPEGVHGPSQLVDHQSYRWNDAGWHGLPFKDLIFYELHVGAFTPEGTFEAIIPRLDDFVELGINALELMPVNQFPGSRDWGYDGVYIYAVQNSYGGPEGLKKLVDACHQKGIAVFLDVVYNHLGPEGNYLGKFAPYFTGKYRTPWGDAINFDGPCSDEVCHYFADNLYHWFANYHIDGIRADAVHEVYDRETPHFWVCCHQQVQQWQQQLGKQLYLVAESDFNSPHVVKHPSAGGWGFNAQWLDDFHHALYVLLDKKGIKYYVDFGRMQQLAKAYKEGFVHSGEYVKFRRRRHGASSAGISGEQFLVFSQNHDIVGNRPGGERWSVLLSFPQLQLAAAAVILSPYVPLLFMGEEYGEDAPFYFFADYSDESLRKALREGRKKEFEAFHWDMEPKDALDPHVFLECKLQWHKRNTGSNRNLLNWYRQLIALRREHAVLTNLDKNNIYVTQLGEQGLVLHRQNDRGEQHLLCLFNFSDQPLTYTLPTGEWKLLLTNLPETDLSPSLPLSFPAYSVWVYQVV